MSSATLERKGTAILDLVIVIGIIAILVSITVPMMLSARDRANRTKCAYHLREIGSAMRSYAAENHGRLPCTRPATGPVTIPDVSNSGYAAADPFGPDGPGPNNIPSILFLLLRTRNLPSYLFVCPNTQEQPDRLEGIGARNRSNFSSIGRHLSYGVQNPYANDAAVASGFRWNKTLPDSYVIAADKGPGGSDVLSVTPQSPREHIRKANSPNHEGLGQNVLYADGRVEFQDNPFAGLKNDNIYATRLGKLLDSPANWADAILLPARE